MSEVFILIPGDPRGKMRAQVGKRGKNIIMFTPAKQVEYEQHCAREATLSMEGRPKFTTAVELKLQIFIAIPPSYSKKKAQLCREGRMVPTKMPDFDNVCKSICDAFNDVVWNDDVQVVDSHITKRFGDQPCVIATVTPLDLLSC